MREFFRENEDRNRLLEIAAVITTTAWVAYCIWLGFHGHIIKAILFGILLSPLIYLSFAFISVGLERKNVKDTTRDMFDELNSRVGKFTADDALAFEAAFNKKTPDNIWHEVNIHETGNEILIHVIHYWHNGKEREWNSELKMYFEKSGKLLTNWELYLNKGASKLTKYNKLKPHDKYDVFFGPR